MNKRVFTHLFGSRVSGAGREADAFMNVRAELLHNLNNSSRRLFPFLGKHDTLIQKYFPCFVMSVFRRRLCY